MNIGRPRKLSREAILEIAMDVFWEKGYEATSIADILSATGLHKGSLYQTFRDKKTLFIATLDHYLGQMYQLKKDVMQSESDPITGLKKFLHEMLSLSGSKGGCGNKGCMIVNTLVETAPHDIEIRKMLEQQNKKFQTLFVETLNTAQAEDGLKLNFPAEIIFGLLMSTMNGLSNNLKNMISLEEAHQLLEIQLQLLGLNN
ncbi:MAG: TetR/AcrR family transcriptional regulator [Alcanivoracaceae bacterium]|nr:TetR/AcrR family transcriptional regulator [Alcanivoracaceae bacterium]